MARPMPRLPPVTTAVLPASEKRLMGSAFLARLLLARDGIAGRLRDDRRRQSVLLRLRLRRARSAELVAHADELDGAGRRLRQRLRHRTPQPTQDVVVLRCHETAGLQRAIRT